MYYTPAGGARRGTPTPVRARLRTRSCTGLRNAYYTPPILYVVGALALSQFNCIVAQAFAQVLIVCVVLTRARHGKDAPPV